MNTSNLPIKSAATLTTGGSENALQSTGAHDWLNKAVAALDGQMNVQKTYHILFKDHEDSESEEFKKRFGHEMQEEFTEQFGPVADIQVWQNKTALRPHTIHIVTENGYTIEINTNMDNHLDKTSYSIAVRRPINKVQELGKPPEIFSVDIKPQDASLTPAQWKQQSRQTRDSWRKIAGETFVHTLHYHAAELQRNHTSSHRPDKAIGTTQKLLELEEGGGG